MLAETVVATARIASFLDQRVELPETRLEIGEEQALADAIGGDHQLRGLEFLDQQLEQHCGNGRRREPRRRCRRRETGIGRPKQLSQLNGALRLHPVLMSDRQWEVGRQHVDARERAPRSADHIEVPASAAVVQH